MKIKKIIHKGYTEVIEANKKGIKLRQMFGKYQFIYSSKKGEISLIQLKDYWNKGEDIWEIYELSDNNLFEDVERFNTKIYAIKRIKELLQ